MRDSRPILVVHDGLEDLQFHTDDWNLPTVCDLGLKSSEAGKIYLAQNSGSYHLPSKLDIDADMQGSESFRSQMSFRAPSEDGDDNEWKSGSPRISMPIGIKCQCGIWDEIIPDGLLEKVEPVEKEDKRSPDPASTQSLNMTSPSLSSTYSDSHSAPPTPSSPSFRNAVTLELRSRADNDRLVQDFDNDGILALLKEEEGFRRVQWAKQMILLYPEDCGNVC